MGTDLEPLGGEDKVVSGGQFVVAAVVDVARLNGLTIPPAWIGIIGRQAKSLIDGGFEASMVIAAAWMAVLRGAPTLTEYIAGDLALAASGMRMSRAEYETKVAMYGADQQARPTLLQEQRERLAARRAEIEGEAA